MAQRAAVGFSHQPVGHQTHPKAMGRMGRGQSGGKVTKVPIDENKIMKEVSVWCLCGGGGLVGK